MKPLPAPNVPGKTEYERFDNAVRKVLTVSKEELLRREQREHDTKEREEKRPPKKQSRAGGPGRVPILDVLCQGWDSTDA
jgi:hypothetical protein